MRQINDNILPLTTSAFGEIMCSSSDRVKATSMVKIIQLLKDKFRTDNMPDVNEAMEPNEVMVKWLSMLACSTLIGPDMSLWRMYYHSNSMLYMFNAEVYDITAARNAINKVVAGG